MDMQIIQNKNQQNLEVKTNVLFWGGWTEGYHNCWKLGGNNEFEVLCMTYVICRAWKLCLRQKKCLCYFAQRNIRLYVVAGGKELRSQE